MSMRVGASDRDHCAQEIRRQVGVRSVTRRDILCLLTGLPLIGCGGGDNGAGSTDLVSGRTDEAVTLDHAEAAGFRSGGPTQTVLIGFTEQFFHFGSFGRVLIAPLTPGQSVIATRGLPVAVADDEQLVIVGSKSLVGSNVLEARGARGFNLRAAGLSSCTVSLYLQA